MTLKEFQEKIATAYATKFSKSLCICTYNKTLGGYISIDCFLGAGSDEFPHRIAENDAINVKLNINLPRGWSEETELPDVMTIEAIRNSIKHKPSKEESYFYCKYTKVIFRKTRGSAENIIKTFGKFVDRLYRAISEQYTNDNLLPGDMELFANKYERC